MTVHFIGAGPGAPDLLTLRGRDLIAACPVCLYAGSLIPDGVPCFSNGWPDEVLARAGLRVAERELLDPGVRLEVWRR